MICECLACEYNTPIESLTDAAPLELLVFMQYWQQVFKCHAVAPRGATARSPSASSYIVTALLLGPIARTAAAVVA